MVSRLRTRSEDDGVETTRNRILDVAERLFAARGIENVSLREVTSAAGVNLAAVHYHLGSREELLRAILVRRMTPLLEQRQRRLERVARKGARNARLEQIVRAFVEPSMEYDCSTDDYLMNRLITRLAVYERRNRGDLIHIILAEANDRFIAALAEVLPQLDCERLGYRFEFMVGLVTHATVLRNKLSSADQPVHGITDARRLEAELITAIVAQFLAG